MKYILIPLAKLFILILNLIYCVIYHIFFTIFHLRFSSYNPIKNFAYLEFEKRYLNMWQYLKYENGETDDILMFLSNPGHDNETGFHFFG